MSYEFVSTMATGAIKHHLSDTGSEAFKKALQAELDKRAKNDSVVLEATTLIVEAISEETGATLQGGSIEAVEASDKVVAKPTRRSNKK